MGPSPEDFRFDPRELRRPRPPGISAVMRIKNGDEFLRLAIESHLPYYDEIVACHNGCTDQTVRILKELAAAHTEKIRIYEYLPHVHPALSPEHDRTSTGSVHGLANYYNWALSKASFSHATKLDDDHLAIEGTLRPAIELVRRDIARGLHRIHTFSGLNAARNDRGELGVLANAPFVGNGDHMYFPVCDRVTFRQAPGCERFHVEGRPIERAYVGLLYVHLKYAKAQLGLEYLDPVARRREQEKLAASFRWESFEQFASAESVRALVRNVPRIRWVLRTHPVSAAFVRALTGRNPPLPLARLTRLKADLDHLHWQRDVIARLSASKRIAAA